MPTFRETKVYRHSVLLIKKYERFWIPLMLLLGLCGDVLQFSTFNIWLQFAILGVYVLVSTGALLLISNPQEMKTDHWRRARLAAPFLHQFAVGGLLSTSLLFYWFSGAASISWPLLVLVSAIMLANEFVRTHFMRPAVQTGVLSFSLFSLSAILFSFVFNSLAAWVFLLSGVVSFVFMLAFTFLLIRVGKLQHRRHVLLLAVTSVFAIMSAAYFGNIIPPIPLALREAGIYHNLTHVGQEYVLEGEEESWIHQLLPGQTIHANATDALYAYTSIFAPGSLSTTIVHKWQFYDVDAGSWVMQSSLSFPIVGGRAEGYRGYSRKSALMPGKWRVSVETPRGQVLGRLRFTVVAP